MLYKRQSENQRRRKTKTLEAADGSFSRDGLAMTVETMDDKTTSSAAQQPSVTIIQQVET